MDPNVITAIVGVAAVILSAIIGGVWLLSSQINALGGDIKALNARVDGLEARLGNLEREVHSINELLRRPPQ